MPPDSLVLKSNIVQGGTNAKPDNVGGNAKRHLRLESGRIIRPFHAL
jgi:hypothetical protein